MRAPKPTAGKLTITSAAFPHGANIPARYTCTAGNVSPPLQWGKLPAGTEQLVLFAISLNGEPSQGPIRWAVSDINPSSGGFAAGQLPAGAVVGRSSEGHDGWVGPCPAKGRTQSMVILVYALRHKVKLATGFEPSTAQHRVVGNALATGLVYGTYTR